MGAKKGWSRKRRDKEPVRRWALREGRKVLWKDEEGNWHAATNRANTPEWATETEDL